MNQRRMTFGAIILVAYAIIAASPYPLGDTFGQRFMAPLVYVLACYLYLRAWREPFRMPKIEIPETYQEPVFVAEAFESGKQDFEVYEENGRLVCGHEHITPGYVCSPLQRARDLAAAQGEWTRSHTSYDSQDQRNTYLPAPPGFPHEVQDLSALRGRSLGDTATGSQVLQAMINEQRARIEAIRREMNDDYDAKAHEAMYP